jgi:hypothetical protein
MDTRSGMIFQKITKDLQDEQLKKCLKEYQDEKWRIIAQKMGLRAKACEARAKALRLK